MIHKLKIAHRLSGVSVAMVAAMIAAPVYAQEGDATEDALMDEIVVTAQKRSQSLSDVSLSVSAVGSDKLASTGTGGIEGLQNLVPSISFGNDFNFAKLFIRGIGLSSSLPGVDPSVALHVDGAVVALAQAQLGSMFDLERVEVLRGPQGTLYGRNATGGAVNLITAKPTDTLEGYVRATVGGDNLYYAGEGAISGPLTEGIRARLALRGVHRDGYGINEFTGNDVDNVNQWSGRLHLEFLPTEKLSILLTGEYHKEHDRSLAVKFRAISFPGTTTPSLTSLGQRDGASFASDPRNLNTNYDPINHRKQWALTGTISYELDDVFTLKSITSYRDFEAIFFHDFDMSSYAGYRLAQTSATQTSANHWQPVFEDQFSEELQLNIDTDKLHGIAAFYYLKEKVRVENHIGFDVLTNTDPFRVQFDGTQDVETWAAFANLTYDLTDQLSLKAGGRYSWEKRHLKNNSGIGSAATGFVLDALQWDHSKSWTDFSPTLGVEYRPNDDLLLYFNWARGFKSGTAEIGSRRSAVATTPFVNPEEVEAFEGGLKATFQRVQFNLAVFHQKLENGQFQRTFPIAAPPFFASRLENAAVSEANGAELEVRWRPTRGLVLDASIAYLDSKFTSFFSKDPLDPALFGPGGANVPDQDLSGNRTRMSPEWSLNLNPSYEFDLSDMGSLQLASNIAYRSKQYHTEFNDDRLAQDPYWMIDANMLFTTADERYSLNLWVKNLTDEFVWAGSYAVATSRTIGGTLMPPRTYGATFGFKF
ncbi:iron complex outermembrane receptor protein [Sphingobium xanthum]|uniref:TonB-dependent receptor n=1 Tax=Sphingobium xanthum TaxID=1387165 RepID=UPI001C8B969F|nr:TonB-dependent receptor [Sphingobium xanthum]